MSTASTGRYQSRLLNLLLDKSQKLSDRMGRAARQVKTATIWSIQLLIYPVYAMFQTGRLAGQQIQQAVNKKLRRLQGSAKTSQGRSPVATVSPLTGKQSDAIASDPTIETVGKSDSDMPLWPLTDKADELPLIQGFHKLIHWMETGTIAVKVNLFKESKLIEHSLPLTSATSGKSDRQVENMPNSAAVSSIASEIASEDGVQVRAENPFFLKAVDRTVAQLEAGEFPQWQEVANGLVAGTRSLWEPVKNWYMWQGKDILDSDDDDLTRDLWAEPVSQIQAKAKFPASSQMQRLVKALTPQLPGKTSPQFWQKSEAAIRTTIANLFGKVSTLVHSRTVNSSVAQIPIYQPSPPATTPVKTAINIPEQEAFAVMAAELAAVTEPKNSLVDRSWDLLRTNAANIKENLAIYPVGKSSQSLATVATAATAKIQKLGETVGQTVGATVGAIALNHNTINKNSSVSDIAQTETAATGLGEPEMGRDYIEAKVLSTGYIKHPLEMVLEWVDWVMLRGEKIAIDLIKLLQEVKKRLLNLFG